MQRLRWSTRALLLALTVCLPPTSISAQAEVGKIGIVISTDRGDILATLDSARAPVTVTNFLRYLDAGHFTGGAFHRTVTPENQPNDSVRIEVIQGRAGPGGQEAGFDPIPLERTGTTGLHHRDGTLSMARSTPNSATSSFFITIGDQPALDEGGNRNLDHQGFAAFGVVTSGMDVVRQIQRSPREGQTLVPAVLIRGIRRAAPR